jgi:parallel beta-helix repeat protein
MLPSLGRGPLIAVGLLLVVAAAVVGFLVGGATGDEPVTFIEGPYVRLELGADLGQVMADQEAGTSYLVAAGTHRRQRLQPKDGDIIIGEPGAVLDGAEELNLADFQNQGGLWVLGGRTETLELHGDTKEGFERDGANQELWYGAERLRHVSTRDEIDAPGEWFFDYDAGEIVMYDVPDRRDRLELSLADEAINSDATGVSINDLTVTRYASRAQRGAIQAEGPGWQIDNVTVSENHGGGVMLGDGGVLTDSVVTNNGQLGVGGHGGADIRVEDNEIAFNGSLGFNWFWEAGGTKFTNTRDLVFTGNWVHHNDGPGIWVDLDTYDSVIRGNLSESNDAIGIYLEVSFGAEVTGNTVRGNGFGPDAASLGAGISVSNVSDALIRDNLMQDNSTEFAAVHYDRASELTGEPFGIQGLRFEDNYVRASTEGAVAFYVDTDEDELYSDGSVVFANNTYVLDGCEDCFVWDELVDAEEWVDLGNDVNGTFERLGT